MSRIFERAVRSWKKVLQVIEIPISVGQKMKSRQQLKGPPPRDENNSKVGRIKTCRHPLLQLKLWSKGGIYVMAG